MGTIRIVCGWCKRPMGTQEGEPIVIDGKALDMTHGICAECKAEFFGDLDIGKEASDGR